MPKKTKPPEHGLHVKLIACSVIAGIALAACQPRMTTYSKVSPQPSSSPVPTVSPTSQKSLDKEVDTALDEMDASIKANNPNEVSGSDLR